MKIPTEYIIQIGLLRKQGKCASCKGKMDFKDPNIQLCSKCRDEELKKETRKITGIKNAKRQ